jgi:putative toxin-antitoxin system antitoxin component (TIGR02293 family)
MGGFTADPGSVGYRACIGEMDHIMALLLIESGTNAMSIFTLTSRPLAEQIQTIERGFPSSALAEIAAILGLPKARIIEGLKLVVRTITQREKKHERFSPMESERLYRVVRVRALAREIFSADAAVAEWMSVPDRSLGNRTPLEMLATDLGAQKVENLLRAMMHGVPR